MYNVHCTYSLKLDKYSKSELFFGIKIWQTQQKQQNNSGEKRTFLTARHDHGAGDRKSAPHFLHLYRKARKYNSFPLNVRPIRPVITMVCICNRATRFSLFSFVVHLNVHVSFQFY